MLERPLAAACRAWDEGPGRRPRGCAAGRAWLGPSWPRRSAAALAAAAPEEVAAGHQAGAHLGATDEARHPGPLVDVRGALGEPRHLPTAECRLDVEHLVLDGDDPAGRDAEGHQPLEVVPDEPPRRPAQLLSRGVGGEAVPEEHLRAVDVADAGEHRL